MLPVTASDLAAALANRRWSRRTLPFPHVVAQDVFVPELYRGMAARFDELLRGGDSASFDIDPFRLRPTHHFYAASFLPETREPFEIFLSASWRDLFARVFRVTLTDDVNGGLHHHGTGSRSGGVHNDFNPGWFVTSAGCGTGHLNVSGRTCDYKTGCCSDPTLKPQERVRAVAILFYVNNPACWSPADGGETALYAAPDAPPSVSIPPINNSLLAFECTPRSFHAFRTNRTSPRNSVILWLHRTKQDAIERWGDRLTCWPMRG